MTVLIIMQKKHQAVMWWYSLSQIWDPKYQSYHILKLLRSSLQPQTNFWVCFPRDCLNKLLTCLHHDYTLLFMLLAYASYEYIVPILWTKSPKCDIDS